MNKHGFRGGAYIAIPCIAAFLAAPAPAKDSAPRPEPTDEERAARLEAALAAQQKQIERLEQQVVAVSEPDVNAARGEEMKKQIRAVLSEQEFRESLMASTVQAGYDGGFFIRSSDDKFKMVFNGLLQFRWTYYHTRRDNRYLAPGRWAASRDRSGFDLQRARFRISGSVYSPDLTYVFELEQDAPDGYNSVLSEAWVNYRFVDELQFKAGYFRPASTRMQFMDNGNMQFVDRGLADAVFGFGYGLGVRVWGQAFNKRLEYYLDVLNSVADGENVALGRTITTDEDRELDNNPAIVFRTVWHALGPDPTGDFAADADLPRHESPALDFGFHYAFNEDNGDVQTTRIPFPRRTLFQKGGFGLTNSNGLQINQFGVDAAFKYKGFSVTGEYIMRLLDVRESDDPVYTQLWRFTGDGSTTAQHGAYVQAGYFLPIPGLENKLEAVARVGGISTLSGRQEGTWEYASGMNYYIQGNKVKVQADVTKVSEAPISAPYSSLANVNDDALVFRMQLQVAF